MFFDFTWRVVYKERGQAIVNHVAGSSATHYESVTDSLTASLALAADDFEILQITYSKGKAQ